MTPKPTTESRGATMLWAGVVAVVVVLGVVAVVLARSSGEDPPPIEDETAAVTLVAPAEGGTDAATLVEGGLPPATETGDPAVGMTIPTVRGTAVDGSPITIGPDGTPKVIVFMAHWCPHCQREIPVLADHFAEAGLPDDVDIVGVATRTDADSPNYPPSSWLEGDGWTVPTLLDSPDDDAFGIYGMGAVPGFLVVDAEGRVVVRTSGELPTDVFDGLVEAARTGQLA